MADKTRKGWDDLKSELDLAEKAGHFLPLWWRDDDAIEETPALLRLYSYEAPLVLAVIPALMKEGVNLAPGVKVAQHGYDHRNRAPLGEKKSEFPLSRDASDIVHALRLGRDVLERSFASDFLPLFVPPWNRFAHAPALWQQAGFKKISTYTSFIQDKPGRDGPREEWRMDTHIDLIDWRNRRFLGEDIVLQGLCRHLRLKRLGKADKAEPTGFLSHHLVHDGPTWSFLDKWIKFLENEKNRIGWISLEVH